MNELNELASRAVKALESFWLRPLDTLIKPVNTTLTFVYVIIKKPYENSEIIQLDCQFGKDKIVNFLIEEDFHLGIADTASFIRETDLLFTSSFLDDVFKNALFNQQPIERIVPVVRRGEQCFLIRKARDESVFVAFRSRDRIWTFQKDRFSNFVIRCLKPNNFFAVLKQGRLAGLLLKPARLVKSISWLRRFFNQQLYSSGVFFNVFDINNRFIFKIPDNEISLSTSPDDSAKKEIVIRLSDNDEQLVYSDWPNETFLIRDRGPNSFFLFFFHFFLSWIIKIFGDRALNLLFSICYSCSSIFNFFLSFLE